MYKIYLKKTVGSTHGKLIHRCDTVSDYIAAINFLIKKYGIDRVKYEPI